MKKSRWKGWISLAMVGLLAIQGSHLSALAEDATAIESDYAQTVDGMIDVGIQKHEEPETDMDNNKNRTELQEQDHQDGTEVCANPKEAEGCDNPKKAEGCDNPKKTEGCDNPKKTEGCDNLKEIEECDNLEEADNQEKNGSSKDVIVSQDKTEDVIRSQDITDDVELTRKEIKNSITDPVYEAYIREHANARYTKVDHLKLVNAILVKQSMFDRDLTLKSDTIDVVMSGIENGVESEAEKYITQITTPVALYELSEDSSYYVAYVNTMRGDDASVREAVFATYDNDGHVLDNCIYEDATGLAYIPKADCLNEKGEQIVMNVQIQLMQLIPFGNPVSEVVTAVEEHNDLVKVTSTSGDVFEVETVLQTECGMKEEDLVVAVNGIPIQDRYFSYNSEMGELTLTQSPAMIQSVSIMTEEKPVVEQIASALFQVNDAYALSVDQMTSVADDIELPDWVTDNTLISGSANYCYKDNYSWTYSYGFGIHDEDKLAEMIRLIEDGGNLDLSKVQSQNGSKYITTCVDLSTNNLQSNGQTIEDLKKIPELHMECCHASTALGSVSNSQVGEGIWRLLPVRLRFLKVNREAGYAILGIYTVSTHTQAGTGFFKIKIRDSYGYGNIGKKDGDSKEVLGGAIYYLYEDEACNTVMRDPYGHPMQFETTTSWPYSNTLKLDPGLYYVKEYKAPPGYGLDKSVKKLNIQVGKRTWANNEGADEGWNYDYRQTQLRIHKLSAIPSGTEQSSVYSKENITFWVYKNYKDARTGMTPLAKLSVGPDGYTDAIQLDLGIYYIKEKSSVDGFKLCRGSYDDADSLGIHEINVDKSNELYTVTCVDEPYMYELPLEVHKYESVSDSGAAKNGTDRSEGKPLAHCIFQLSYFENADGVISDTPDKCWLFETDEEGKLICNQEEYYLPEVTLRNGKKVRSAELIYHPKSQKIVFPLGMYKVTELQAPEGYQLQGEMYLEGVDDSVVQVTDGIRFMVNNEKNTIVTTYVDGSGENQILVEQLAVQVYDLPERVHRSGFLKLPDTGGTTFSYMCKELLAIGLCIMGCIFLIQKYRKENAQEKQQY